MRYFLKEYVATLGSQSPKAATFRALVSALRGLGLDILREDETSGEVRVRCLTSAANMPLWRCWSDELLFKVNDAGQERTTVVIYAIPNLLRIRVRKGEKVSDLNNILARVKETVRNLDAA